MRVFIPTSIAATAALVTACNSYGAPPAGATAASAYEGRQCFYAPNVSGYRRGQGDTVIVNTNNRDYYQFRTQPYCADRIDWENRIALRSRTGSFICNGYDAEIYVPEAIGAAYCPLYDMRKLTPAEVAHVRATPPRDKR
jgi:hypothetical protein